MRKNWLLLIILVILLIGFSRVYAGPKVLSLTANPPLVYYSSTTVISAEVSNPDSEKLTYTWIASTGIISGNNETALYQAPLWAGDVLITLKVDDSKGGVVQSTKSVSVVIAQYSSQISEGISAPARITTDELGNIYVTDSREGKVVVYNPLGEIKLVIEGLRLPSGIAVSQYGEKIYVLDQREKTALIYNEQGEKIGNLGEYVRPNDVALLQDGSRIYVTDDRGNLVKVFWKNPSQNDFISEQFYIFDSTTIFSPSGIVIDEDKGRVYIANKRGTTIRVFNLDNKAKEGGFGAQAPSYTTSATQYTNPSGLVIGNFTNLHGLGFDPRGYLFGVDSTWAKVQVFDRDGKSFPGNPFIGNLGTNPGELRSPVDAVVDRFRRLLITNSENGRIEIYNLKDAEKPRIISRLAAIQAVKEPDPTFYLRDYYVFPNPAKRRKKPVIHLECGIADKVEIRIYNVAAELVHSVSLDGRRKSEGGWADYQWCLDPKLKENNKWEWAYEYPWEISDIASGVYVVHIHATKVGYPEIKVLSKFAVIK